jgi:hypothetical protein
MPHMRFGVCTACVLSRRAALSPISAPVAHDREVWQSTAAGRPPRTSLGHYPSVMTGGFPRRICWGKQGQPASFDEGLPKAAPQGDRQHGYLAHVHRSKTTDVARSERRPP